MAEILLVPFFQTANRVSSEKHYHSTRIHLRQTPSPSRPGKQMYSDYNRTYKTMHKN